MGQLRSLRASAAWPELVAHLNDIPAGERDSGWDDLAEEASMGLLADSRRAGDLFATAQMADALLDRFPKLAASDAFMSRRSTIGLLGYERCYESGRAAVCTEELRRFAGRNQTERGFAFDAGRLVIKHRTAVEALPFFRLALEKGGTTDPCKDDGLQLAVQNGLELPPGDTRRDDAMAVRKRCRGY